ncbi:MAG: DUF1573 domain-containing protein [Bacteroidia bacterium]
MNLGLGFKYKGTFDFTEDDLNKDLTALYESALATNPAYPSPISRVMTAKSCLNLKYQPSNDEMMNMAMMKDSLRADSINKAVEALAKRVADSLAHVSYLMDKDEHGNKKKRKEEEAFDNRPDYEKKAEALKPTQVQWLEEEYDFKTIKEGDIVTHTFKVKNTGNKPLIITHVKPSCGCTATNWTKEAIPKGKEGSIEIKFDSKNHPGTVSKTISVYGNYEGIVHQLRFKGDVTPDPNKVKEEEYKSSEETTKDKAVIHLQDLPLPPPIDPSEEGTYEPSIQPNDEHGDRKKVEVGISDDGVPDYQKKAEALEPTHVQWLEEEYDFKTIKEGDIVTHTFKVRNVGVNPLIITHVKPSCGCTATNWTKEAIPSGGEGSIEIKFDSKNRPGTVQKTITVYGNYQGITHQLRFKGEVKPDPKGKRK